MSLLHDKFIEIFMSTRVINSIVTEFGQTNSPIRFSTVNNSANSNSVQYMILGYIYFFQRATWLCSSNTTFPCLLVEDSLPSQGHFVLLVGPLQQESNLGHLEAEILAWSQQMCSLQNGRGNKLSPLLQMPCCPAHLVCLSLFITYVSSLWMQHLPGGGVKNPFAPFSPLPSGLYGVGEIGWFLKIPLYPWISSCNLYPLCSPRKDDRSPWGLLFLS